MLITVEMLQQNTQLSGLTAEQFKKNYKRYAIVEVMNDLYKDAIPLINK